MNNIYVLNKSYKKIGTLSNQGANPQAPYYEDLYTQELETGADTYQFSTTSSKYTQDILEIGNHIMFAYKNRNELFTITSLEYSHYEGYKTIGVYAEGIGFDLLEVYMKRPENEKDEGGRDEDNDGDTSTDDEYADLDDMYLDENGIIVYDKDGSGPPKEEDMYVDENGIIVYRRNKRNREKDSLEFKNISYSRFLSILLKNTGWSYVCQPGLESVKHDITVRYDTNIFALLQDSMQSYRGVELEFVHELVGGKVQKVIKAYKDGGRGSFVGKRFEYGTNVRGITKMQEVANSEDDTVLYVDNVGIAVQYDVDFALKSAEIPEIEIGDTHYVIDRDFCPPMTIKARIGKIEISFSDPTKNKIYLANNKKISGSAIEDEFGADDVADMLDDYEFDGDSDSIATNHDHNRILAKKYIPTDDPDVSTIGWASYGVFMDDKALCGYGSSNITLGMEESLWNLAYIRAIEGRDYIHSPRYFGYNYQVYYDRDDMEDIIKITDSSNITKQDLLNFVINDLNVYEYSSIELNEIMNRYVSDENARFGHQNYLGLLSDDMFSHGSPCKVSKVGARIGKSLIETDANNDGDQNTKDGHNSHVYNIPALLAALIGAFQHYVNGGRVTTTSPSPKDQNAGYDGYSETLPEDDYSGGGDNPGTGEGGDNPGTGGGGNTGGDSGGGSGSGTFGDIIVDSLRIYSPEDENYVPVRLTNAGIGADIIVADSEVGTPRLLVSDEYPDDASINIPPEIVVTRRNSAELKITPDGIKFADGSTLTSANGLSGEGVTPGTGGSNPSTGNVFDTITVRKIQGPDPGEGQFNRVEFADAIGVTHIYCAAEDENRKIFIGDDIALKASMFIDDRILLEEGGYIEFPDGSKLTSTNDLGTGGGSSTDNITASKITIGTPTDSKASKCSLCVKGNTLVEGNLYIEGGNGLYVNGTPGSDKSLKENIRYVDNTGTIIVDKENLDTRDYHNEDLLEKTDLHDFIVNQVNICEYNFIGKDRNKIGFIANEYEGTKVGDKIVNRDKELDLLFYDSDNLLFATIGALQEEVRIKDEKIASLEDRLAKIEAMLGINNDN